MKKIINNSNYKLKPEIESLFSLLNDLKINISKINEKSIDLFFKKFFGLLNNYCEKQENLMDNLKYPEVEIHRREHKLLKEKINYLFQKFKKRECEFNSEIIEIIENLLNEHLKIFDNSFTLYFTNKIDPLTKFLSLKYFFEELYNFIEKIQNSFKKDLALLLLEIRDFPILYFSLDFQIAELFLKDFSNFLKNSFDSSNLLLGIKSPGQILIGLLGYSFLEIISFLETLIEKIKNYKFKIDSLTIEISVSIGIAFYPQDGNTPEQLLKSAEIALQMAKRLGKNRWEFFDLKILKEIENFTQIKTLLEKSIREGLIIPYIQPVFDAKKRNIMGGEVLLRLLDENKKLVAAKKVILQAIELGYIEDLEDIITQKITQQKFLSAFKGKYIFINKSITSYEKLKYLLDEFKLWKDIANKNEVFPVFEITELSIINFLDIFHMLFQETRTENIFIAIDDFGAGYASFTALSKIDPNFLKIDGNLVSKINLSKKFYCIIKSIISLSKDLGIKTIAEFVEDEKTAIELQKMGVDYFQSFYFCRPLPLEEFKALLKKEK